MFFMRTDKGHKIKQIEQGSIAQQEGICAGDSLLSIIGTVMEDIFDYQYQVQNDHVELVLLTKNGEEVTKIIDKDEYESALRHLERERQRKERMQNGQK